LYQYQQQVLVQGGSATVPMLLFAVGTGNNDIVFTLEDSGGDGLDGDERLTVTALIQTESNAGCSLNINT